MDQYFHLAQINIANAKDEMCTETMSGFVARLDEINAVADQHPGFVWRLQGEDENATAIRAFDDPLLLINISVWENIESLRQFVYKSIHIELIRDREAWFDKMPEMHQALWWIPAGHIPTIEEAKAKLELICEKGPTEHAFSFAKRFDPS